MTDQSSKNPANGELEIGLIGLALLVIIFGVLGVFLGEASMLPYFFGTTGLFFLFFAIGAFNHVPLIKKWTPGFVFNRLVNSEKDSSEKGEKKAFFILAMFNFALALLMFFFTLRLYI